jgi:uncharacterized RDD family membrane protein YckC
MENNYGSAGSSEHLLDDLQYTLIQAGSGKRFGNWLIDRVAIYLVYRFLLFKPVVAVLTLVYQYSESRTVLYICSYLFYVTFLVIVLAAQESLAHGKTLGKMITGTRAVNEDGTPISGRTAFLRNISRLVPFEAFSALGSPCWPWHDRWTKTYVIDDRQSTLPV